MPNVGGRAVGRLTEEKFEKLVGASKLSSRSSLWRTFWGLAEDGSGAATLTEQARFAEAHPRGHYRWRGEFDKRGRAIFRAHPAAPAFPASYVAWLWENERPIEAGETLRAKCGRKDCVRPEHHEVVRVAR